ncbi:hypothetical protein [Sinomicrobium weinanense]|uniref:Uncharacterized protein n=1 Tax=Sinomicrobium weinanense TaxID=2842200 RepID=A0A926JVS2_9FLAO|nr:hypothetical protein [Sinomicrobium weinanense]MBC9798066.1 hypothetical protein [Sinomicrobium weinanense]MBU3122521.1 hypothetical protein [Sinomicrobium weinanense]
MKNKNAFLKFYAVTLTAFLLYIGITGFRPDSSPKKFEEITVERINVVEPDGKLKMVISNSDRQHPGMLDGKMIGDRKRPPGIIFFNEEQDEVGGLGYGGNKKEGASMVFSVDQYKNDQIMQMQYSRNKDGKQRYGLKLWDRSEKVTLSELIHVWDSLKAKGFSDDKVMKVLEAQNDGKPVRATRMFTGKNFDDQVGMFLKDEFGNDRIKIYVDENNEPKIEILNSEGKVSKVVAN